MGSLGGEKKKKPRVMCLHGFRTSGYILSKQLAKWPDSVLGQLDLVFVDAPLSGQGKSDVEGFFPPPYYEWFRYTPGCREYEHFDECLAYIEECMIKHGPFDGFLGFSQGALLSAALPGLQAKGLALTKVPKIKFVIIVNGGTFASPALNDRAYSLAIACPSIHFIGENDFLMQRGKNLLESFEKPVVVYHYKGHTVPRLDEESLETVLKFIKRINEIVNSVSSSNLEEEEGRNCSEEVELLTREPASNPKKDEVGLPDTDLANHFPSGKEEKGAVVQVNLLSA
ncbi:hypothetical protein H6P81_013536 [Aristolochia fimbriata]|uniref:Serine hydrolase domain-containing protein n=1 Tax=Aristolochia fimbriata TaxID=158543 RepID=A0AAV7EJM0_ARIFI|nr:hypothetical protein H6P81_013536 [Aristolochia fimbriata]